MLSEPAALPSAPVPLKRLPVRWAAAAAGIAVSVLFTVAFLWGLHPEELRAVPTRVVPELVVLSALVLFLEFPLRAVRWAILLAPLGGSDSRTRPAMTARRLLPLTLIGFMCNNVLPARAGELVRPYLAARDGRLPFESVLMTAVLERGFDMLGLATVALLTLFLLPGAGAATLDSALLASLTRWSAGLGGVAVVGLLCLCLIAMREEWRLLEDLAGRLPAPVAGFAARVIARLREGLRGLRGGWRPLAAAGVTAIIWINGAVAIWLLMQAFQLGLPFVAACFLSLTLALAVVLPQAPGFIGVFQVATQATLTAWGVDLGASQGFAILFWLVSFAPVTVAGLVALWSRGLSITGVATEAASVAAPADASAGASRPAAS